MPRTELPLLFLTIKEWWPLITGGVLFFIAVGTALSKWRKDALAKALAEIKSLRKTNTQLELEAKIRIDDLIDYQKQIDELQVIVIEQRERSQRMITDHAAHQEPPNKDSK